MSRLWMIWAVTALLVMPTNGHALVDMRNANYSDSWLDLNISGLGYNFRVNRTYNSRSIFVGMFGFGWCSDFETVIEKLPEGRLKLTECGAGQEITYTPTKFHQAALDKLTEEIIAHYKKKNPQASPETIQTLRQQVRGNNYVRSEWAKDAGLDKKFANLQKGMVFTADGMSIEKIIFDGVSYTRQLADGSSQRFNAEGKLTALYDKNGNYLKFTYNGAVLKDITDNTGKRLTFTFYPNRRVKEIVGPGNIRAEYKYKGENLVEVVNMWKNKYTYEYDDTHNLTKIVYPDNTFKALTYNQKKDWVTSFTERANEGVTCSEYYTYETSKTNPKDHFWSIAVKKCNNEVVNESRFEFWYKTGKSGKRYLSRVLSKSLSDSLDVTYHPENGRPVAIKKDGVTTTFDYYPNGLIKERTTPTAKMVFEYKNEFNKVSKVTTHFFDDKGKVIKKRDTVFGYDKKANLVTARNSDGQSVQLTYDDRGRIATIVDQAKKEVIIKYDERTGKPGKITRPKVGTIVLTYKKNGEINKVESSDGPTVAVQIASTFSNLLDIIAPATSDLSL